jgi:uncharacterized UBP type Zn finger protein
MSKCTHLEDLARRSTGVVPSTPGCAECLATGGEWLQLRICLSCGHVGCCDSSTGRHATEHYHRTQHPVVRAFEPGEEWGYCYLDRIFHERVRAFSAERAPKHYEPEAGP